MAALYDKTSVSSILDYAQKLIGHSLTEVATVPEEALNSRSKGNLGELVEKYFFQIEPPNSHSPDFPEAGLELKTTGVILGSKQKYLAKERLVLTNIHPRHIRSESWQQSTFLNKCRLMLILFYLYDQEKTALDRKFVYRPLLMDLFSLSESDIVQIEEDWNFIKKKCQANKAHELSEGDTTYLKACRKGSGGPDERLVSQGDGEEGASSRAFSFPKSFMSRLLRESDEAETSILLSPIQTVEEAVKARLSPYFGQSISAIASQVGYESRSKSRNYHLVSKLLTGDNRKPLELEKAGITLRTVTLQQNGVPKENIPFLAFDPFDLVSADWEDSQLSRDVEARYLFAIFAQAKDGGVTFQTAGFWTMSYRDRVTSRGVWEVTREKFARADYDLTKKSENPVMFLNTHGRDSSEKVLTPAGDMITKRSFWLSKHYFSNVIMEQLTWG